MDYAALKAELQDPRYAAMTAEAAAGDLNQKRLAVDVPTADIVTQLATSGSLDTLIEAHAGRGSYTDQRRKIAGRVLFVLQTWRVIETSIDAKRAAFEAQMDALIGISLFAQADKDAIQALYADKISRAEQLGLLGASTEVSAAHVVTARAS